MSRFTSTVTMLFDRSGHLAVWIALYVGACVVMAGDLLGSSFDGRAFIAATTLAAATYLLDRVRLSDALLDPADAVAHPTRHAFIHRYRRPIRLAMVVLTASATVVLFFIHPLATLLAPLSLGGVLIYGGLPTRPRVKDLLVVKNLAVAGSIASLSLVLWSAANPAEIQRKLGPVLFVAGFLLLHIFADSIICDLDDIAADQHFGTRTLPNAIGTRNTWLVAIGLNALAFGLVLLGWMVAALPASAWLCYGGTLAVATGVPGTIKPKKIRNLVDAKLPVAVGIAYVLTRVL